MTRNRDRDDALSGWRNAVGAVLTRLSRRDAEASGKRARPAPRAYADPTVALAPNEPEQGDADALPLTLMLEDSARAMTDRARGLREDAARLAARIGERIAGEITLRTQAARILISAVWLGAAAWLYVSALNAQAVDMAVLPSGTPVGDAFVLTRIFFIVAAVGLGVAFAAAALANGFGRGDNRKVRAEAERLGRAIADDARAFDSALDELRAEMDRRSAPGDAVIDLSRAHMTALEACAYFRDIAFLTSEDERDARKRFRAFLQRPRHGGGGFLDRLTAFVGGAALGAFLTWRAYAPAPETLEPQATLPILQYPWALALLAFGAIAYAGVGVIFSMLGGVVAGNAGAKAREEALDALRGAFTAREAPRPADVIRRIEDAVDVFRARVGARPARAPANHGAADLAATPDEGEVPLWRRRDSSVKFVETGFQAVPARWRTDPHADFEDRKPGSKRGFFGLKNHSRD